MRSSNGTYALSFSPDGQWLASSEGGWRHAGGVTYKKPGRGISLVNLSSPEENYYCKVSPVSVHGAIDFSPDSRSLVIGDFEGGLYLWDVRQQRPRKKAVETGGGEIWRVRYSPDGETIVVAGSRGLELREADSLELIEEFASDWSFTVDFAPDGQFVACPVGKRILLLNASNLKEITTLEGHTADVWEVAFLPDGKTLASRGGDHTVKLWNIETGQEVATLRGHRGCVTALAASHDGNMLASSGDDKTARIWRASPLDGRGQPAGQASSGKAR